jgi:hypothetical protein
MAWEETQPMVFPEMKHTTYCIYNFTISDLKMET